MKKGKSRLTKQLYAVLAIALTLILQSTLLPAPRASACIFSISPNVGGEVKVEEIKSFTLSRQVEHRRCPSSIDIVVLHLSNMKMVDDGDWIISGRMATREIKVQFIQPGEAILRLSSSCTLFPTRPVQLVFQVMDDETELPPAETDPEPSQNEPSQEEVPQKPPDEESKTPETHDPENAKPESNISASSSEIEPIKEKNEIIPPAPEELDELPVQEILQDADDSFNTEFDAWEASATRIELEGPPINSFPSNTANQYRFSSQDLWILAYFLFILLAWLFIRFKWYRWRILFLLLSVGLFGYYVGGCLCPIGWIERSLLWIKYPAWGWLPAAALLVLLGVNFFLGRIFCGWVCPQGALQDILYRKRFALKIPYRLERYLQWGRSVILGIIAFMALVYSVGWFCSIGPFKAVFQLFGTTLLITLSVIFLTLSLVMYRPFCRFFCPLGALFSAVNWLAVRMGFQSRKLIQNCSSCRKCLDTCPSNVLFLEEKQIQVRRAYCIECGDCMIKCPHDK